MLLLLSSSFFIITQTHCIYNFSHITQYSFWNTSMPYPKSELSKLIEITLKPGILQLYTQGFIKSRGNSTLPWRMGSLSFMGSENCFIHLIFISNVGDISESIRITNKREFQIAAINRQTLVFILRSAFISTEILNSKACMCFFRDLGPVKTDSGVVVEGVSRECWAFRDVLLILKKYRFLVVVVYLSCIKWQSHYFKFSQTCLSFNNN